MTNWKCGGFRQDGRAQNEDLYNTRTTTDKPEIEESRNDRRLTRRDSEIQGQFSDGLSQDRIPSPQSEVRI